MYSSHTWTVQHAYANQCDDELRHRTNELALDCFLGVIITLTDQYSIRWQGSATDSPFWLFDSVGVRQRIRCRATSDRCVRGSCTSRRNNPRSVTKMFPGHVAKCAAKIRAAASRNPSVCLWFRFFGHSTHPKLLLLCYKSVWWERYWWTQLAMDTRRSFAWELFDPRIGIYTNCPDVSPSTWLSVSWLHRATSNEREDDVEDVGVSDVAVGWQWCHTTTQSTLNAIGNYMKTSFEKFNVCL